MAGAGSGKVKPLGWLWFAGLMLGILACLPSMFEALCAKTYETHRHGVAVVTCASSPLGKAAVEALIEDGYLVRGRTRSIERGRERARRGRAIRDPPGGPGWLRVGQVFPLKIRSKVFQ